MFPSFWGSVLSETNKSRWNESITDRTEFVMAREYALNRQIHVWISFSDYLAIDSVRHKHLTKPWPKLLLGSIIV
jgi:hypothetical protein